MIIKINDFIDNVILLIKARFSDVIKRVHRFRS